jgi:dipeptidase E
MPEGKRLLFLPTAVPPDELQAGAAEEWIRSAFFPHGVHDITMWVRLPELEKMDLSPFDAVYIGGGNTFWLRHQFRETGFDRPLLEYVAAGGIVYGTSAGAIIFGKDIAIAGDIMDPDIVGLGDTSGYDLLRGHDVWCHYRPEDASRVEACFERRGNPVLVLTERAGLHVDADAITVIGPDPVLVFRADGWHSFAPDSPLQL